MFPVRSNDDRVEMFLVLSLTSHVTKFDVYSYMSRLHEAISQSSMLTVPPSNHMLC
jgi:hypothetical protein